eukprot:Gregarina_sp_Pseudo_9__673@NODE_1428_length_1612_cov_5_345836_g1326_i0_p1_GENE_NODE_1428_length_1612_cov_5_345836_g1326_i0NODE_1428_length_1612_cov_5_345836_g1326_i0_p1_ORF_typecomplete_len509_score194_09_NODE_1428_length_1612_cov_5_345836_g1326_i031529
MGCTHQLNMNEDVACDVWDVVELLADSNKVLQTQNARLRDMLTELLNFHFKGSLAKQPSQSHLTSPSGETRHAASPSSDLQPAESLSPRQAVVMASPRGTLLPKSPRKAVALRQPRPSTSPPQLQRGDAYARAGDAYIRGGDAYIRGGDGAYIRAAGGDAYIRAGGDGRDGFYRSEGGFSRSLDQQPGSSRRGDVSSYSRQGDAHFSAGRGDTHFGRGDVITPPFPRSLVVRPQPPRRAKTASVFHPPLFGFPPSPLPTAGASPMPGVPPSPMQGVPPSPMQGVPPSPMPGVSPSPMPGVSPSPMPSLSPGGLLSGSPSPPGIHTPRGEKPSFAGVAQEAARLPGASPLLRRSTQQTPGSRFAEAPRLSPASPSPSLGGDGLVEPLLHRDPARGYFHPLTAVPKDGPLAWTLARPTARRPSSELGRSLVLKHASSPLLVRPVSRGDAVSDAVARNVVQRLACAKSMRPRSSNTHSSTAFFSTFSGESVACVEGGRAGGAPANLHATGA